MRKLISFLLIAFCLSNFLFTSADAARFGGGRSFGYQRSASSFTRSANPSPFSRSAAAPTTPGRSWLGPLAGLAAGGLLASLFMHNGSFGGSMMSWLLMAFAGYMAWQFIRNRMAPATQPMQSNNISMMQPDQFTNTNTSAVVTPIQYADFLRETKAKFIRLQAAYDSKNLDDLREFTTPEVFAEINLQLQERGHAENITEVVSLNAEFLNTEVISDHTLSSVRFTGFIRENKNPTPESFNEVWHFRQDAARKTWDVAGVQQN